MGSAEMLLGAFRRRGGGGAPFDPTGYPGLTGYWLGTDAAVTSGSVSVWPPRVAGANFTPYSGSATKGTAGGKGAVVFGGAASLIASSHPISDFFASNGLTVYWVGQLDTITNSGSYSSNADNDCLLGDSAQYLSIGADTQSGGRVVCAAYAGGYAVAAHPATTGQLVVLSARIGPSDIRIALNGVETVLAGSHPIGNLGNPLVVGGSGRFSTCKMIAVATYNECHDDADHRAIIEALAAENGITLPPPVWTPAALSPDLWLPARLADLSQDTAGSTPVTSSGQSVERWRDEGSLAAHFTEGATPPTAGATAPPRVAFNGTTQTLSGSGSIAVNGPQTLWFKARLHTVPGGSDFYGAISLRGASALAQVYFTGVAGYTSLSVLLGGPYAPAPTVGVAATLDTSEHSYVVTFAGGDASDPSLYHVWIDGASQTVAASGATNRGAGDSSMLGSDVNGSPILLAPVDLAEVGYVGRVLSGGEVTSLNTYLAGI